MMLWWMLRPAEVINAEVINAEVINAEAIDLDADNPAGRLSFGPGAGQPDQASRDARSPGRSRHR